MGGANLRKERSKSEGRGMVKSEGRGKGGGVNLRGEEGLSLRREGRGGGINPRRERRE